MNRNMIICLAVVLVSGYGFCQEAKPGMKPRTENMPMEQGMQQGMQQPGMMCPMMGQGMNRRMMQQGMMGPMQITPQIQMVTSDNGGIIVLRGDTLYKFDRNLNLIKKVELPHPEGKIMKKPVPQENK
ncbi:MAG TPA: hypothetical protein PLQ41_01935 [bacterium]|nr:hypothetical protein [bacterium]HPP29935.1 hypothetical protein [bacterium]